MLLLGGGPARAGLFGWRLEAALRSGAGLVKVVTWAAHQASLLAGRPELMCEEAPSTPAEQAALATWATVRVLGPGLGLAPGVAACGSSSWRCRSLWS